MNELAAVMLKLDPVALATHQAALQALGVNVQNALASLQRQVAEQIAAHEKAQAAAAAPPAPPDTPPDDRDAVR